ncbi:hypothetical protein DB31_0401 [Hyalangium minutum]|uniref:Uncharacterized protein n=1 Tax=Hyalangium minutum TaxID=394096 RepID=A0A085WWS7_9BACT|nr:hypothetical protein DB31_0401 [Hyalangium minutum]
MEQCPAVETRRRLGPSRRRVSRQACVRPASGAQRSQDDVHELGTCHDFLVTGGPRSLFFIPRGAHRSLGQSVLRLSRRGADGEGL